MARALLSGFGRKAFREPMPSSWLSAVPVASRTRRSARTNLARSLRAGKSPSRRRSPRVASTSASMINFPFSLPHFFLVDWPPLLDLAPYREATGCLCLLDDTVVAKFSQPGAVIGDLLRDAFQLVCDCESGANQNDFRTEFYSYWNRRLSTSDERIQSLLEPHGESRLVHVWRGEIRSVIGETEEIMYSDG